MKEGSSPAAIWKRAKARSVTGVCLNCRKNFSYIWTYEMKKGQNFCSKECKTIYNKKGGEYIKRRNLKYRYKLSLEDWQEILDAQNGKCPGCDITPGEIESQDHNHMSVDHDKKCCNMGHKSCGKCIRGILCSKCNLAIGYAKDNPQTLRHLADYLESSQKKRQMKEEE